MYYNKYEENLSIPRINRYLIAEGGSKTKAKRLYRINLRVSQAFYPILNFTEICLRNRISEKLSSHFSNSRWIISEKSGFMSHVSLGPHYQMRKDVERSESRLRRTGSAVTVDRLIADQTFGFWASMFNADHMPLIASAPLDALPLMPTTVLPTTPFRKLNKIRKLRNRIYHNEPICFSGSAVNFNQARSAKRHIYELLNWMDADLAPFINYFDSIDNKINAY